MESQGHFSAETNTRRSHRSQMAAFWIFLDDWDRVDICRLAACPSRQLKRLIEVPKDCRSIIEKPLWISGRMLKGLAAHATSGSFLLTASVRKGSRTVGRLPLPITRIERIVSGSIAAAAAPASDGRYACHEFGSNIDPVRLSSLDEVADFLRANPKSSVRMNPGWTRISRNLYIDDVLLR